MSKMKVNYKAKPNLVIEFEAAGQKELFEEMAGLQEILNHTCQRKDCKGKETKLHYAVREVDGNKFYELKCECGAALGFGSHKVGGTLFPQRKDQEGEWLPNNGWTKWNNETKKRE